jgi:deoxyribodipyrimidine photo-lyase
MLADHPAAAVSAPVNRFRPTRNAGLDRLSAFLPRAARHYADHRAMDLGPHNRANVSLLSPYLRHRLLREDEVLKAVLKAHEPLSVSKFVEQVMRRGYWKGWLELRPAVFAAALVARDRALAAATQDPDLCARLAAAEAGRTGIECFDAWVREATDHGYLHASARGWFASIWVHTLKLPWPLGYDFFMRYLVDGDAATNLIGWRSVCGLHAPERALVAQPNEIAMQTAGRFRPTGLAGAAVPVAEPALPAPRSSLPPQGSARGLGRIGLLVTEDDLAPESLDLGGVVPSALAAVTLPHLRSPRPVSPLVTGFAAGAVDDAVARAAAHFALPGRGLAADPRMLAVWARDNGLEAVVTAYAPVGHVAQFLDDAEIALASAGLPLVRLRRAWDSKLWPAAQRGLEGFKDDMPRLFVEAGLPTPEFRTSASARSRPRG